MTLREIKLITSTLLNNKTSITKIPIIQSQSSLHPFFFIYLVTKRNI